MKNTAPKIVLFLFCSLLCINCKKSSDDATAEVCLTNASGHTLSFWAHDGGHFREVGPSFCGEASKGGSFSWGAEYPTPTDKSFVYARWKGDFNVGDEDIDFKFTDQADSLIYDHRDERTGLYTIGCEILELNGNDTIGVSTDTLSGVLSKAAQFNQIKLEIAGIAFEDVAIFPTDLYNFQLQNGGTGQMDPFNKISFTTNRLLPNGNTLRTICAGKKD
jgi:hypothetical protein